MRQRTSRRRGGKRRSRRSARLQWNKLPLTSKNQNVLKSKCSRDKLCAWSEIYEELPLAKSNVYDLRNYDHNLRYKYSSNYIARTTEEHKNYIYRELLEIFQNRSRSSEFYRRFYGSIEKGEHLYRGFIPPQSEDIDLLFSIEPPEKTSSAFLEHFSRQQSSHQSSIGSKQQRSMEVATLVPLSGDRSKKLDHMQTSTPIERQSYLSSVDVNRHQYVRRKKQLFVPSPKQPEAISRNETSKKIPTKSFSTSFTKSLSEDEIFNHLYMDGYDESEKEACTEEIVPESLKSAFKTLDYEDQIFDVRHTDVGPKEDLNKQIVPVISRSVSKKPSYARDTLSDTRRIDARENSTNLDEIFPAPEDLPEEERRDQDLDLNIVDFKVGSYNEIQLDIRAETGASPPKRSRDDDDDDDDLAEGITQGEDEDGGLFGTLFEDNPVKTQKPYNIGFPNPTGSNSCWMNASLQVLLGMRPLIEALSEAVYDPIILNFMDVARKREQGRRTSLAEALRQLKKALGQLDETFASTQQQDAPEFMTLLLDHFRQACRRRLVSQRLAVAELMTLQEQMCMDEATLNLLLSPEITVPDLVQPNPVQDNIAFMLQETYSCTSCQGKICKAQEHLVLFVDVPSAEENVQPTLQLAVDQSMQAGTLDMNCAHCKGTTFVCSATFKQLPRFLIIQVKRYSVDKNIKAQKVTDSVQIPVQLELGHLLQPDATYPRTLPEEKEDWPSNTTEHAEEGEEMETPQAAASYRLAAVVSHYGITPQSGHYVADVYHAEQQSWFHYDDDCVSKKTEEQVLAQTTQENGYLFLYRYSGSSR